MVLVMSGAILYYVVGYGTGYGWCYSVYYACTCIMW